MAFIQLTVGPQRNTSGNNPDARGEQTGEISTSDGHGRFFSPCNLGNLYGWGKTVAALSANSITLTATTTPIIGVWNPASSPVNLNILQASLQLYANNLTSGAGPGALVWAVSNGNGVISTGNVPYNRKTLAQAGAYAKGFDLGTALTGITNNLVIIEAGDFSNVTGLTYTTLGSTAILPSAGGVQNFDGQLIVPPGGVLALLNTTSSTTFSAAARILWEEVPILQ